jgi:hypothetical protein
LTPFLPLFPPSLLLIFLPAVSAMKRAPPLIWTIASFVPTLFSCAPFLPLSATALRPPASSLPLDAPTPRQPSRCSPLLASKHILLERSVPASPDEQTPPFFSSVSDGPSSPAHSLGRQVWLEAPAPKECEGRSLATSARERCSSRKRSEKVRKGRR